MSNSIIRCPPLYKLTSGVDLCTCLFLIWLLYELGNEKILILFILFTILYIVLFVYCLDTNL